MSVLTRPEVLSEQKFLKAWACFPCCTPRTQTIYRDRRLASNLRYSLTIPRSFFEVEIVLHGDLEIPTISKYMEDARSDSSISLRCGISSQCAPSCSGKLRTATSQSFYPSLPYSTRPPLTASVPGRRKGNRPVTVPGDILCRGDSLQASSIVHVTRRVLSGRARGFQPHTTHAYGREGVRDRHFLPPPRHKRKKNGQRKGAN
ncbi:hypothetical protein EVAR_70559_1 [Eumeta japonica]|uniref:Uncharacterized protein n=1 Tax=Eumeta variegata TaxID=151549 RepID=A0A4C2AEP4_EUMVA|nr:hypothetical protein EVAR_70559_1 [Eumeta japonica]